MNITHFFIAAAGGFVVMAAVTIQALVTLFVTFPAMMRVKRVSPELDEKKAMGRAGGIVVAVFLFTLIATIGVILLGTPSILWGYWLGFFLALGLSWKQFVPGNQDAEDKFRYLYADCFVTEEPEAQPEPAPLEELQEEVQEEAEEPDPEVVTVSRPGR